MKGSNTSSSPILPIVSNEAIGFFCEKFKGGQKKCDLKMIRTKDDLRKKSKNGQECCFENLDGMVVTDEKKPIERPP